MDLSDIWLLLRIGIIYVSIGVFHRASFSSLFWCIDQSFNYNSIQHWNWMVKIVLNKIVQHSSMRKCSTDGSYLTVSQITLIICLLPSGKGIISWILSEMVIRADIFRIPTPQLKVKHVRNLEHAMCSC